MLFPQFSVAVRVGTPDFSFLVFTSRRWAFPSLCVVTGVPSLTAALERKECSGGRTVWLLLVGLPRAGSSGPSRN